MFNCLNVFFFTWPPMPASNPLINQIWRLVNFPSGDFWTECEWGRCWLGGHPSRKAVSAYLPPPSLVLLLFPPSNFLFHLFYFLREGELIKTGEWLIRFWQATPYLRNTCPWRKPPRPTWLSVVNAISTANTIPKLIETRCSVAPAIWGDSYAAPTNLSRQNWGAWLKCAFLKCSISVVSQCEKIAF